MSSPKLLRILQAVAARVAVISRSNGDYTDMGADVRLDAREAAIDSLPVAMVYLGDRSVNETKGKPGRGGTATCAQSVSVVGYHRLEDGEESEVVGIHILADIQKAVEGFDAELATLLLESHHGLNFQSDEIFLPELGENVVGARVTYALPHIRKSGDPIDSK